MTIFDRHGNHYGSWTYKKFDIGRRMDMEKDNRLEDVYQYIKNHAEIKNLANTKKALPLCKQLLFSSSRNIFRTSKNETMSYEHCLKAAKLLVDLHISLSDQEEDYMLAGMLCYDMLDHITWENEGLELVNEYGLEPKILEILRKTTRPKMMDEDRKIKYYDELKKDKIAFLLVLADHSNLVENLSELTIFDVNEFVCEMRKYVLQMCVYGKQYYRECQMSITIMMEKIRSLIDVADIIAHRYQKRELAYENEVLSLMEENARLRGMIHQLENAQA